MKTYSSRSLLGALIAPLLLAAAPAHAEDQPATPDIRYLVAEDASCWTTPDAHHGDRSPVRLTPFEEVATSKVEANGTGLGGGDERFRFVLPEGLVKGCWVPSSWLSDTVTDLDLDNFDTAVVLDTGDQMTAVGGVLARHDLTIFHAPSLEAPVITEADSGDVYRTWEGARAIRGGSTLLGEQHFVPLNFNDISTGWVLSDSIRIVPRLDPASLTTSVILERDVALLGAPATGASIAEERVAGEAIKVGDPYQGYLPVASDGGEDVLWLREADLLADPEPTETASPTAEPTDQTLIEQGQEWITGKKEQVDAKIAEVKAEKARAIALARLRLAGLIAAAAVALALIGHSMSNRMRRGIGQIASDLAAGGPVGLVKHLTIPGAMVGAVLAAWLAPTSHFLGWTLAGSAGVGLLVAGAAAVRTCHYADRSLTEMDPQRWQYVGLAALAGVPALHFVATVAWPAAIVVSLIGAGVLAGVLGPRATVLPTLQSETEPEKDAA